MKVSDYIVEFLIEKGITDTFGYPGGMITHLMDSFDKYRDKIKAHINYHEQASSFSACGYSQASNKPGVAYATSGPGATNLLTGVCNAFFDSIPCIFITGQVNTYELKGDLEVRQKGFQETDIVGMVKNCTKYATTIMDASLIRVELEKAYFECMQGRPGPVLLDIPMDIQRAEIDKETLSGYSSVELTSENLESDIQSIIGLLKKSTRPCLVLGAGVRSSGAFIDVRHLVKILNIPVVTSMNAIDILQSDSPLKYGFLGAYGDRYSNFILAKSDLIISIGSRLDCRQVGTKFGAFAPDAKLVRIDIDKGELTNKVKSDEIQICQDAKTLIISLASSITKTKMSSYDSWLKVCYEIKEKLLNYDIQKPNYMIGLISKEIEDNLVITTDVGQNQVWIAQSFYIKEHQKILFSGGHGAMGYSLPAAIGAFYATKKNVICFCGDGGFQMNIQELQFIVHENLPIKIIVLNNKSLGMIRHFQEMYFDSNFTQTTEDRGYSTPDIKKIAYAYEINYRIIEEENQIKEKIWSDNLPEIIEVLLKDKTYVYPKLAMGKPNQDQEPEMDRKLYDYISNL